MSDGDAGCSKAAAAPDAVLFQLCSRQAMHVPFCYLCAPPFEELNTVDMRLLATVTPSLHLIHCLKRFFLTARLSRMQSMDFLLSAAV